MQIVPIIDGTIEMIIITIINKIILKYRHPYHQLDYQKDFYSQHQRIMVWFNIFLPTGVLFVSSMIIILLKRRVTLLQQCW